MPFQKFLLFGTFFMDYGLFMDYGINMHRSKWANTVLHYKVLQDAVNDGFEKTFKANRTSTLETSVPSRKKQIFLTFQHAGVSVKRWPLPCLPIRRSANQNAASSSEVTTSET